MAHRLPFRARMACAVLLGLLLPCSALTADEVKVIRVEEDWELVVGDPDSGSVAPQVVCVISPTGGVEGLHATFEINHQNLPQFVAGGMQLQLWHGDDSLFVEKHAENAVMATAGETVRWTTVMLWVPCGVKFGVFDGSSTTWGNFGSNELNVSTQCGLDSLNGYNPAVSVAESGVGFAGNRVSSLKLLRVRLTLENGTVLVHNTPTVVHPVAD